MARWLHSVRVMHLAFRIVSPCVLWMLVGCATFDVQQSSLVPAATPPPPASFDRVADVYAADTTVVFLDEPERSPNETAGLWIPRHQIDGAIGVRFGRYMGMQLTYRQGLSAGAMRAAPTTLQNPGRDVRAAGIGMSFRVPLGDEPLELHVSWHNALVQVPSHVEATCVSFCGAPGSTTVRDEVDGVLMLSAGASLQWSFDEAGRGWLGLVGQTHPTNQERFASGDTDAEVEMGPLNLLASIGVEIELVEGFSVIPQLQVPITARPVRYGPILGLGLRGSFGSEVDPARRRGAK